ncbi:MAG: thioesterase family protein [Candidatus Omnitrophica bacterium]|nr:thioesterase family protein [Candidatus Omnitrophota bacterium]
MKVRIYYHDTDCGGVVYYSNYLKYIEEARTDFFEERGILIKKLADSGILFVVARQEIDYKFPSFYADILDIRTWVSEIGSVKLVFESEIKNQDGKLIANTKTILVCVDKNLKPRAIPEEVKKIISNAS